MKKIRMTGELPVFGETSAARAVSRLLRQLERTTNKFEDFFTPFQLTVQNWKIMDVEQTEECFFFEVQAEVLIPKNGDVEELQEFVSQNEAELYHNETGFLPAMYS